MASLKMTRRALIAGTGLVATSVSLGRPARAQPAGFRVIRARALSNVDESAGSNLRYDGILPGPVLRVRQGEEVMVRLANELSVPTATHWHGVRLANAMDGTSLTQEPIVPGGSFDYRFAPPDAGTFWYHPLPHKPQVAALYGLLIVDEKQPVDVDRDVALIIDRPAAGFTVNALASLDVPVATNERLRLRLLNASADRFVSLRLDRHPVTVMAIDGQPAEPFIPREGRVTLWPGNRVDLFVDCVLEAGNIAPLVVQNDDAEVPLARLVYEKGAPARTAPRTDTKPLPATALPDKMDFRGAQRAELALETTGGKMPGKPLLAVKRGRTVMLALVNRSAAPVVAHIHGHSVRLLDNLDDGWKPFWLDTILCVPQKTTRIAFVADNPGKWMISAPGADPILAWFAVT